MTVCVVRTLVDLNDNPVCVRMSREIRSQKVDHGFAAFLLKHFLQHERREKAKRAIEMRKVRHRHRVPVKERHPAFKLPLSRERLGGGSRIRIGLDSDSASVWQQGAQVDQVAAITASDIDNRLPVAYLSQQVPRHGQCVVLTDAAAADPDLEPVPFGVWRSGPERDR